jgi:hypothetical protein
VIALEDFGDGETRISILVNAPELGPMIKIGAAGEVKFDKKL